MTQTYDVTFETRGEDLTIQLTQPTSLEMMFDGLSVPDSIMEGRQPETAEEREACERLVRDLIEEVTDTPIEVAECLPPTEFAKLIHASAKVYTGDGPSLDEFDTDENTLESPDAKALAANAYPHFDTGRHNNDDVGFDRESEKVGVRTRTVARGE